MTFSGAHPELGQATAAELEVTGISQDTPSSDTTAAATPDAATGATPDAVTGATPDAASGTAAAPSLDTLETPGELIV